MLRKKLRLSNRKLFFNLPLRIGKPKRFMKEREKIIRPVTIKANVDIPPEKVDEIIRAIDFPQIVKLLDIEPSLKRKLLMDDNNPSSKIAEDVFKQTLIVVWVDLMNMIEGRKLARMSYKLHDYKKRADGVIPGDTLLSEFAKDDRPFLWTRQKV